MLSWPAVRSRKTVPPSRGNPALLQSKSTESSTGRDDSVPETGGLTDGSKPGDPASNQHDSEEPGEKRKAEAFCTHIESAVHEIQEEQEELKDDLKSSCILIESEVIEIQEPEQEEAKNPKDISAHIRPAVHEIRERQEEQDSEDLKHTGAGNSTTTHLESCVSENQEELPVPDSGKRKGKLKSTFDRLKGKGLKGKLGSEGDLERIAQSASEVDEQVEPDVISGPLKAPGEDSFNDHDGNLDSNNSPQILHSCRSSTIRLQPDQETETNSHDTLQVTHDLDSIRLDPEYAQQTNRNDSNEIHSLPSDSTSPESDSQSLADVSQAHPSPHKTTELAITSPHEPSICDGCDQPDSLQTDPSPARTNTPDKMPDLSTRSSSDIPSCNPGSDDPEQAHATVTSSLLPTDSSSLITDPSTLEDRPPHQSLPPAGLLSPPTAHEALIQHIPNSLVDTDASNNALSGPDPDVECLGELPLTARQWRWVAIQRNLERISPVPIAWWPSQSPDERLWKARHGYRTRFDMEKRLIRHQIQTAPSGNRIPTGTGTGNLQIPLNPLNNHRRTSSSTITRPLLQSFFSGSGTNSPPASSPPNGHSRFWQSFKQNLHPSRTNNQPPAQPSNNTPGPLTLIVLADHIQDPFRSVPTHRSASRFKIFYVELDETRDLTDGELFDRIRKEYNKEAGFLRWKNLFNMHCVSGISFVKFVYGCGLMSQRGVNVPSNLTIQQKSTPEKPLQIEDSHMHLYKFSYPKPGSGDEDWHHLNQEMQALYWRSKHAAFNGNIIYQQAPKYRGTHLPVTDPCSIVEFVEGPRPANAPPPQWKYGYGIHLEVGTRFHKVLWACGLIVFLAVGAIVGVCKASKENDVSNGLATGTMVLTIMPVLIACFQILVTKEWRGLR